MISRTGFEIEVEIGLELSALALTRSCAGYLVQIDC